MPKINAWIKERPNKSPERILPPGLVKRPMKKLDRSSYAQWIKNKRQLLTAMEQKTNLEVKGSPVEGRGLFAKKGFYPGAIISAYPLGPFERLLTSKQFRPGSLFDKLSIQIGVNAKGEGIFVAVPANNPRAFVNHSCEPNCGLKVIGRVGKEYDSQLMAIRPIKPGEELTIDYSTVMHEAGWKMECACGSKHCRKVVTHFSRLPKETREKYIQLGVVQPFAYKK